MFYTMQVTVASEKAKLVALRRPCVIETLTAKSTEVTMAEIELVAEAFKKQIVGALLVMVKHVNNG